MEVSVFLIELGAVILGLAVLARAAGRFGLSPIPLYLLVGLAFGEGGLHPLVTAQRFIEIGSEIGVILLLFMLGLEYTGDELRDGLRTSAPAGGVDLVLNFVPGLLAGFALGWGPVAALFLGGITYISSSGIVAKLLEDLDWIGNREVPTVLSILVIEDLLMTVYLPAMAVLLLGTGALSGAVSLAVAVVAVAAVLVVAIRFGHVVSRWVFSRSDEALLLTIFGLTLLVAGVAEALRVSAAIGAFLVGIAISGPVADRAKGLLQPLRDLFAAAFFIFFGLSIDPGDIPGVAAVAAGLAVVTAASKLATGWWAARRAGSGLRGRARAGAALIARGEFSIAIARIGVAAGVQAELGPLAATYVLLLAVLGPVLARVADPLAIAWRDRALRR